MITAKSIGLPLKTLEGLVRQGEIPRSELAEIRLRAGRPAVAVSVNGRSCVCSRAVTREELESCFMELCRYSVHSYAREIAEGYITLDGGNRAGFCGTAVIKDGRLASLRDISSINLRIAHEAKGCAIPLYNAVFEPLPHSLLICGKPMSGKTTLLRDLARLIGEKRKVALIDSRGELAAVCGGVPKLDVGLNTDVLNGYPREEGMSIALRTLSPEVIMCDEIGGDFHAIEQCISCGVKLVATVHAGSVDELLRRNETARLIKLFDYAALLSDKGRISRIMRCDVLCGEYKIQEKR